MNLIAAFFLFFAGLSNEAWGQEIPQPVLAEGARIEAQSLGPVLVLQPGEGVTHAMKRGGCGFEYVSLVLQLSELEEADLYTLPVGTPVQLPSSCAEEPGAEIAALSEEILFGGLEYLELEESTESELPSRETPAMRAAREDSATLAAAGFARDAYEAQQESAVLREKVRELERSFAAVRVPSDQRAVTRLESELASARMATLYLSLAGIALIGVLLFGWWWHRRAWIRTVQSIETELARKVNELGSWGDQLHRVEEVLMRKDLELETLKLAMTPDAMMQALQELGYQVILPRTTDHSWESDFLLPGDPLAHVETPSELLRAS